MTGNEFILLQVPSIWKLGPAKLNCFLTCLFMAGSKRFNILYDTHVELLTVSRYFKWFCYNFYENQLKFDVLDFH